MNPDDPQIDFYSTLPPIRHFDAVADLASYQPAPATWQVVVTDVKGSTSAIEDGRYKEVNALGAGSIVTALNVAGDVAIPYVFGGDGATLLIPPTLVEPVSVALGGLARLARRCFELELRVGLVSIEEVRARGADVLVARYEASEDISLAMLSGGGAEVAEKLVKDEAHGERFRLKPTPEDGSDDPSLDGFHCRWNPIRSRNGQTLSLLVNALDADAESRHATYARILRRFNQLGSVEQIHPLAVDSLELADRLDSFDVEARMHTGRSGGLVFQAYRASTAAATQIGRQLMKTGKKMGGFDGQNYPREVVENADFRKFDDALRMVLDVTDAQRDAIEACLADERAAGNIAYGLHAADSALLTCLVFDFAGRHVHFVDGADGGYAMAAKQLKAQLRESVARRRSQEDR